MSARNGVGPNSAETAESVACPVCQIHTESVYRIEGMDCHEEVQLLERRLHRLPGLERFTADILNQRLRVAHDAARLSASEVAEAVNATGMRAWLERERPSDGAGSPAASWRVGLLAISGAALALGLSLQWSGAGRWTVVAACLVAVVAGGYHTALRGLSAIRGRALDINALMLVAVAGAMAIGEWSEAAAVSFLFGLAQWLEARSMARARHAIRELMDVVPPDALVRRDGADVRVPVDDLSVGETVVVRPGERIPIDGRILGGTSEVNQAPITGESLPADKRPGDEVFAGTINGHGALDVEITRLRRDTTMARIINLVEVAQAQRAPSQSFVERFARWYTPAVIAAAALVAAAPPLLFGQPFAPWFSRALVLLVISCPCALVISTPVSIVSALAGAARRGVLIKGGLHLERAAAIRAVAFDKTGTLTRGRPDVVDVVSLNGALPSEVLRLAASLEARSEHPLAQAVVRRARLEGVDQSPGDGFQALPGLGAEARVDGQAVLVGNHRLFEARGLCSPAIDARLEAMGAAGRTAVLVAREATTIGIIGLADETRESGGEAMQALRSIGVGHVVMLTGDNAQTARSIAGSLGVPEWQAELLPADKVAAVADVRSRYGPVAMVGDGVNDAPALASADIGIAMGAAGSAAALETADVALMSDDLLAVADFLRLGRATVRNIRANIAVALGLKLLFLALAVGGVATLWMAVAADMGASLLVIANGLRLRHWVTP
jgi:Zn2+/Cd2+-exporting ATPase